MACWEIAYFGMESHSSTVLESWPRSSSVLHRKAWNSESCVPANAEGGGAAARALALALAALFFFLRHRLPPFPYVYAYTRRHV
jgi:hypothetical protein